MSKLGRSGILIPCSLCAVAAAASSSSSSSAGPSWSAPIAVASLVLVLEAGGSSSTSSAPACSSSLSSHSGCLHCCAFIHAAAQGSPEFLTASQWRSLFCSPGLSCFCGRLPFSGVAASNVRFCSGFAMGVRGAGSPSS